MASDRQTLRVLIHPDDREKMEEWAPEFSQLFDDVEKVILECDSRVKQGGVIIETGTGSIDGRIDKQLEVLKEQVVNP